MNHRETAGVDEPGASRRPSPAGRALDATAMALLAIAAALSFQLVREHFGSRLPGCGPESGCAALDATAWGRVPGTRWPVSFVGAAWFPALLAAAIATRGPLRGLSLGLARAGALASVFFAATMIALGRFCPYCTAIHAANLCFLATQELARRRAPLRRGDPMPSRRPNAALAASAAVFLLVSALLGAADARSDEHKRESAELDRRASADRIAGGSARADTAESAQAELDRRWGHDGFTGRYHRGPRECPIRLVLLTDYQCPDCRAVDAEVEAVLSKHADVSLSVKHFPMCAEASPGVPCNPHLKQSPHPNACWAARAAEAAGILRGDDGFWAMHRWLFAHKGSFTDGELATGLTELGFDAQSFQAVMKSPETLNRVQSDIEDGFALGLSSTPMVFVNGVEFRGWQVPGALARTIEELAAKHLPARDAAADHPVAAEEKLLGDWREATVRTIPPRAGIQALGEKGGIEVVLFGDYQEPYTQAMDIAIREVASRDANVRYIFRHFPIDPSCNPALPAHVRPEAVHPAACLAAKGAEAAAAVGGGAAFWKMHDWLMRNPAGLDDAALRAEAKRLGLDETAFAAAMQKPETAAAIAADAEAGKSLGLGAVPMVFVNRKWVSRPMRDRENVVLDILASLGAK